jgi:hypothetical protein
VDNQKKHENDLNRKRVARYKDKQRRLGKVSYTRIVPREYVSHLDAKIQELKNENVSDD